MNIHINFSVQLPLYASVARDLQSRHGIKRFSGFVYGRDSLHDLRALGFPTDGIKALTQYLSETGRDREPDMDYLRLVETRYGNPHLYLMIAGCRFLSGFEHRRALRLLEAGFRLIEGIFDEYAPTAVIGEGVACTFTWIQHAVAQHRGIPYLAMAPARVNNRIVIFRQRTERYDRADALFAHFKQHGVPPRLRDDAERFIREFRETHEKPDTYIRFAHPPGFDITSIRVLGNLLYRRYLDPDNYLLAPLHEAIMGRLVRVTKDRLLDPRQFEQPVPGECYVFFPLHFQPEATTLMWAPFNVNQIAVIENVAKTLPIDHLLYVKEHKASLGRRPSGYYSQIRRIPNVRLLSPHLDSHELIKASSAVCAITSTVGWEAVLYEKPVITLGDCFYNSFDLVRRVSSMEDLPGAMHDAITGFVPDGELLVKYVAAILAGTYEGDFNFVPGADNRSVLDHGNIHKLSDALATELGLLPPRGVQEPYVADVRSYVASPAGR